MIKSLMVSFCSTGGLCYPECWVWDLRPLIQFQGSGMSLGLFQDFMGGCIKP